MRRHTLDIALVGRIIYISLYKTDWLFKILIQFHLVIFFTEPGKVVNLTSTSSEKSVHVSWMRPGMPKGDIIGYRIQTTVNATCRVYIQENSTNAVSHYNLCIKANTDYYMCTKFKFNYSKWLLKIQDLF
jgi:hypothetical protein